MRRSSSLIASLLLLGSTLIATATAAPASAATTSTAVHFTCSGLVSVEQTLGFDTDAPSLVQNGDTFDVVVHPQPLNIPIFNSVYNAAVQSFSDVTLTIPVPANAAYVGSSMSGGSELGPGTPSLAFDGSSILLTVPGPLAGGTTVTLPTITITLQATTASGVIVPSLDPFRGHTFVANVTVGSTPYTVPLTCAPSNPGLAWIGVGAVETEPPTITITTPTSGATFALGQLVNADYACDDAGVGVASCTGTVPTGTPIDTSSNGPHTFTVDAADHFGNTATQTVTYQVAGVLDASVSGCSTNEGGTCSFPIQLVAPSSAPVSVHYETADGTAVAGVDYTATSGTAVFEPGQQTFWVNVPTVAGRTQRPDRDFTLTISSTDVHVTTASATGTVIDTSPTPYVIAGLAVVHRSATSGTQTLQIPVNLQNQHAGSIASGFTVTVDYTTADFSAHAPDDYTPVSGTITFAPGETSKVISVQVPATSLVLEPRGFLVGLSNPSHAVLGGIGPGLGFGGVLTDNS